MEGTKMPDFKQFQETHEIVSFINQLPFMNGYDDDVRQTMIGLAFLFDQQPKDESLQEIVESLWQNVGLQMVELPTLQEVKIAIQRFQDA
jgi:hypothetical protein